VSPQRCRTPQAKGAKNVGKKLKKGAAKLVGRWRAVIRRT
jgi:hypothetical protein